MKSMKIYEEWFCKTTKSQYAHNKCNRMSQMVGDDESSAVIFLFLCFFLTWSIFGTLYWVCLVYICYNNSTFLPSWHIHFPANTPMTKMDGGFVMLHDSCNKEQLRILVKDFWEQFQWHEWFVSERLLLTLCFVHQLSVFVDYVQIELIKSNTFLSNFIWLFSEFKWDHKLK